jgi:L-fuconolactonase
MTYVDGHVHVFRRASDAYPRPADPLLPAEREAPVEQLLEVMATSGVSNAVLVSVSPDDQYVSECLTRYPGIFAGVLVHDPSVPDSLEDAKRRLSTTGADGLRFYRLSGFPSAKAKPVARDLMRLFEYLCSEQIKVWTYLFEEEFGLLDRVLETYPTLTVVLNHLGLPQDGLTIDQSGRPSVSRAISPAILPLVCGLARFPNVHVHFSGLYGFSSRSYPFEDLASVVVTLHEAFGSSRMIWGSDYPFVVEEPGYSRIMELVSHYFGDLSDEEQRSISGENCARLFNFATGRTEEKINVPTRGTRS